MRFDSALVCGTLLTRYKRFLADVRLRDGEVVTAHCTNTGSMLGCKQPGSLVYLSQQNSPRRKLSYTWEMIRVGRTLVGINTLVANRLVREAVTSGVLQELQGYCHVRSEVTTGKHTRLDFCLEGPDSLCFVEVKNVTLRAEDAAAFPDAVTERGTKHLRELIRLRKKGHRTVLVFTVQRNDCRWFRPADEIDRDYGRWLRRAVEAGVEVLPYRATVKPTEIKLTDPLPLFM